LLRPSRGAARPFAVERRDAFLQDVANTLAQHSDPGPGDVHLAIREAQRKFFDPPRPRRWGAHRQVRVTAAKGAHGHHSP
jgi:hypothetical protein